MKRFCQRLVAAVIIATAVNTHAALKPIAILEVESITALTRDIGAVGGTMGQPMVGMMAVTGMSQFIPGFAAIDQNKPIKIFVLLDPLKSIEEEPKLVMAVSVGAMDILDTLRNSYTEHQQVGNIHKFTQKTGGRGMDVCAMVSGKTAYLSNKAISLNAISELAAAGPLPTLPESQGTMRMTVDIGSFDAKIKEAITKGKEQFSQMQGMMPPDGAAGGGDPMKILSAELGLFGKMIQQVDKLTIGVKATPADIRLYGRADTRGGSALAESIKNIETPSATYRSIMSRKSVFSMAGTGLQTFDKAIDGMADFVETVYESMPGDMAPFGEFSKEMMKEYKGILAGDFALSVLASTHGKSIGLIEVIEVKDPAKAWAKTEEALQKTISMLGEMPAPPMSMTMGAPRTYKGIKVLSVTAKTDLEKMGGVHPPDMANLPPELKSLVELFTDMSCEYAMVGKKMLMVVGSSTLTDRAIDQVMKSRHSTATADTVEDLFKEIKGDKACTWRLSVTRLAKLVGSYIPEKPEGLFDSLPLNGTGVSGVYATQGEAVKGGVSISLPDVMAIVNDVKRIQSQAMKPTEREGATRPTRKAPPRP